MAPRSSSNPDHPLAKDNYKKLARELERLGAQMAVAGKPSFNCATARRPVEKAICANPELANLDREIYAVNARVRPRGAKSARGAQACNASRMSSSSRRNAEFGRAGYDLHKEMKDRLQAADGRLILRAARVKPSLADQAADQVKA